MTEEELDRRLGLLQQLAIYHALLGDEVRVKQALDKAERLVHENEDRWWML